ncbi:hypothetical protein L9F63_007299, partial [Diploptera punctata]
QFFFFYLTPQSSIQLSVHPWFINVYLSLWSFVSILAKVFMSFNQQFYLKLQLYFTLMSIQMFDFLVTIVLNSTLKKKSLSENLKSVLLYSNQFLIQMLVLLYYEFFLSHVNELTYR